MNEQAQSLRTSLAAVAEAKRVCEAEELRAHLALPLSERLRATVALSRAVPGRDDAPDTEAEVWHRVSLHLARVERG